MFFLRSKALFAECSLLQFDRLAGQPSWLDAPEETPPTYSNGLRPSSG